MISLVGNSVSTYVTVLFDKIPVSIRYLALKINIERNPLLRHSRKIAKVTALCSAEDVTMTREETTDSEDIFGLIEKDIPNAP